jgi:chromosome segregation ATPase
MGPDFLQLFGKVHAGIGALTGLIQSAHDRYVDASTRSTAAEERAHNAEQKLAEVQADLASEKQITAELSAKYAAAVEQLAETEEEKQQAREVASSAAQFATDAQNALAQSQDVAAKAKAAYELYVSEAQARDAEQEAERQDVLERLSSVTSSIEGLTEPGSADVPTEPTVSPFIEPAAPEE